jgi:hypothetical protein
LPANGHDSDSIRFQVFTGIFDWFEFTLCLVMSSTPNPLNYVVELLAHHHEFESWYTSMVELFYMYTASREGKTTKKANSQTFNTISTIITFWPALPTLRDRLGPDDDQIKIQ